MNVNIAQYNKIRDALAGNENDDHDIIEVRPKKFALKKEHAEELLQSVRQLLLDDPKILTGITPLHSLDQMKQNAANVTTETILYVLVAYAVGIQQQWIRYSPITNSYWVQEDHKQIVEYVQDTHGAHLN